MTCVQIASPQPLLTLDEAKRQVRRDDTDDDEYLTYLIAVVSDRMAGKTGALARSVMPQTWELRLGAEAWLPLRHEGDESWAGIGHAARGGLPCGVVPVRLPFPPLIAVDAVTYRDDTGAQATLSDWRTLGEPDYAPLLLPAEGSAWPATSLAPECIRIRYRAGYVKRGIDGAVALDDQGAVQPNPPAALKHAALLLLAHFYEFRGASVQAAASVPLPMGYLHTLADYRVRPL